MSQIVILRDRRIAYLLVDGSLRIEEVHDPIGLWADSDLARPGAPLLDLIPELVGCEEILDHLDLEPDSRMELDLVNRPGPDGITAYWRMVALPRPHGLGEAEGLIFLVEDVSEPGALQQHLMQNYNELLLLQRELAHKNLQLAAANAELRGLTEMKSVFVSVAAHEAAQSSGGDPGICRHAAKRSSRGPDGQTAGWLGDRQEKLRSPVRDHQ